MRSKNWILKLQTMVEIELKRYKWKRSNKPTTLKKQFFARLSEVALFHLKHLQGKFTVARLPTNFKTVFDKMFEQVYASILQTGFLSFPFGIIKDA